MGTCDLICRVSRKEYVKDPDGYWDARGGRNYIGSLNCVARASVPTQGRFFVELMHEFLPQSLIDFGCGTGKHFCSWRMVNGSVVAYDRSHTMIGVSRETQALLGTDYSILLGNSCDRVALPFSDGQFDMIVACEVLPHIVVSDIEGTIKEFSRILSEKGVVGAVVSPENHDFSGHSYPHDYKKLFDCNGFDISYDADHEGYRFLVAEKRVADGQRTGITAPRRHLAFSQNEAVGAFKPTGKPEAEAVD